MSVSPVSLLPGRWDTWAPVTASWWLAVAAMCAASAPPGGGDSCGARSERCVVWCACGTYGYDPSSGGTSGCVLCDVPSMAMSGEAIAAGVEVKSTLVARVIVS